MPMEVLAKIEVQGCVSNLVCVFSFLASVTICLPLLHGRTRLKYIRMLESSNKHLLWAINYFNTQKHDFKCLLSQ